VFILYAIPVGLVVGWLLGGRLEHLAEIRFRWAPLALGGLLAQIVLFSPPVAAAVGDLGPPLYVASPAAVLIAVLRHVRLPGIALVAVGALANLAAIVANGGVMPASPEAVGALGPDEADGFSNSVVMTDPALRPLTDIFALPAWMPFANVFSIGDGVLVVGATVLLHRQCGVGRRRSATAPATS